MKNKTKALIPLLFWIVTWKQTIAIEDRGDQTYSMCHVEYASEGMLWPSPNTMRLKDKETALRLVSELKRDRRASEIKMYEYLEVK